VVFDWSIYPLFRHRNRDSIINFETVTIDSFKSHPKPPSYPMMYPIQLDHKSYCQEFRCPFPLFVLAQLRWFKIIKCLDERGSHVHISFNENDKFTFTYRSSRSKGCMAPSVEVSAALAIFLG
jgi:hypothetical protein